MTDRKRRIGFFCGVSLLLWFNVVSLATGSEYPAMPVQIIVPFPPGASTDLVARTVSPKLAEILKQSVVVVNKSGAGGAVGMQNVASAKPDGYTILCTPGAFITLIATSTSITFGLKDFIPLNLAASQPYVIAVRKLAPWKTLGELVDHLKKDPGKLCFSTAGMNTMAHFTGEMFKSVTGTDITHVPMAGQSGALAGLLGEHVDLSFLELSTAQSNLEAGTVRALAVTVDKRLPDYPKIPTTNEAGYPQILATTWHAFLVPAGTPDPIVKKLGDSLESVLRDESVIGALKKAGANVENLNPRDSLKFIENEHKKWTKVAEDIKGRKAP